MPASILGLGVAAPPHSIERDQSIAFAQKLLFEPPREARVLPALYRMTSVQRRGSVLLEETDGAIIVDQNFYCEADSNDQFGPTTKTRSDLYSCQAVPLGRIAAEAALSESQLASSEITHLVVVTCTGFYAPGVDVELIEQLQLHPETQRVQVGFMGCHGAINGLRVALGLVAAEPNAKVLVVSIELCSLHYQYGWDPDRVVSNAIFADGAGAVVVAGDSADDSLPSLTATGSRLVADTKYAMTWRIGDHGYAMTLSAEVPGLIEAKLLDYIGDWLGRSGLTIGDIGGWAVHPGGPRILRAVETSLQLSESALATSRKVLAEHGNMSSATMIFILRHFMDQSVKRPWLMLGFGPGLEIEVALIR